MIEIKNDDIELQRPEDPLRPKRIFGPNEEKAIISLAFDVPDAFMHIGGHLEPDYFNEFAARIVFGLIDYHYNKHGTILSREMCRDAILKHLTADDSYQEVLELVDRRSNPREVPIIRDTLIDFAKEKAFSKLYSEEAIDAHERGDYEKLENILEDARKIQPISTRGFRFFDQVEDLFIENKEEKFTTGFSRLDAFINEGGPTRKEVLCWMAPTGVGKSIMLVNSSVESIRRGKNVLFITLEMSDIKVAKRHAGAFTEIAIRQFADKKDLVRKKLNKTKRTYGSHLLIYEFPADEISVDMVYTLLDHLRRIENIEIDVIIIDYLELMLSRISEANKDEYGRQKRIATELLSLSKKENVLVFTASQTNRSGTEVQEAKGQKVIDLNKVAESYGKTMPLDYIITINQTKHEYEFGKKWEKNEDDKSNKDVKRDPSEPIKNAVCRFYIAKNRNGPKFKTISVRVNYETMRAKQEEFFQ